MALCFIPCYKTYRPEDPERLTAPACFCDLKAQQLAAGAGEKQSAETEAPGERPPVVDLGGGYWGRGIVISDTPNIP